MTNEKINNYKNALVELETIINCLNCQEYEKIPADIIKAIENNKNENYIFEFDENLDYKDWNLMNETKALLYNIYRDYLATKEQKDFLIEREKIKILKQEQEKAKKYNPSELFDRNNNVKRNQINKDIEFIDNSLMRVKKQNFISNIIEKIKVFFNNNRFRKEK